MRKKYCALFKLEPSFLSFSFPTKQLEFTLILKLKAPFCPINKILSHYADFEFKNMALLYVTNDHLKWTLYTRLPHSKYLANFICSLFQYINISKEFLTIVPILQKRHHKTDHSKFHSKGRLKKFPPLEAGLFENLSISPGKCYKPSLKYFKKHN